MTVLSKQAFGPGVWHSIHVTGAWADNVEKFNFFCRWVRNQIENLPCQDPCAKDARIYFLSDPPEKAEDAFVWSWRFHNSVNRKLGKPEMDYSNARQLYLDGGIKNCHGECK